MSRNRHLGYTTKEEFIRDAIRWRLKTLSGKYETIEIPRDEYEELKEALREMGTSYLNVTDFIYSQIRRALEEYREYKRRGKGRQFIKVSIIL
ncbi:hypothetical protein KEJ14_03845 [Candidatus Bathyarchaeota archaeon]|nr:hypothetical protein [Candidatus Bathyarchaeota archaeon]